MVTLKSSNNYNNGSLTSSNRNSIRVDNSNSKKAVAKKMKIMAGRKKTVMHILFQVNTVLRDMLSYQLLSSSGD